MRQVELHGVDTQVGLTDLAGQPLAEVVHVQQPAWLPAVFQAAGGDVFQRVAGGLCGGVFEYLQGVVGV